MQYSKLRIRDSQAKRIDEQRAARAHRRACEMAGTEREIIRARDGKIMLWTDRKPFKEWKRDELEKQKAEFLARGGKIKKKR